MTKPESERIAVLETKFDHALEQLNRVSLQVNEMHELLLKARGAKWALGGIALVAGWLGGKVSVLLPWLAALPK